jgi:hypothetical protein
MKERLWFRDYDRKTMVWVVRRKGYDGGAIMGRLCLRDHDGKAIVEGL